MGAEVCALLIAKEPLKFQKARLTALRGRHGHRVLSERLSISETVMKQLCCLTVFSSHHFLTSQGHQFLRFCVR